MTDDNGENRRSSTAHGSARPQRKNKEKGWARTGQTNIVILETRGEWCMQVKKGGLRSGERHAASGRVLAAHVTRVKVAPFHHKAGTSSPACPCRWAYGGRTMPRKGSASSEVELLELFLIDSSQRSHDPIMCLSFCHKNTTDPAPRAGSKRAANVARSGTVPPKNLPTASRDSPRRARIIVGPAAGTYVWRLAVAIRLSHDLTL
jgi:hypothetical protein